MTPVSAEKHAAQHEDDGIDEIEVDGLAGVLAEAQNADKLQGVDVSPVAPTDAQVLIYDGTDERWEPTPHPAPNAHKTSHASGGADKLKYTRQLFWFVPDAVLETGADQSATLVYRGPDLTLVRWDARVKVAPTDADLILDVLLGGASLWASTPADRPTIAATATSGTDTSFDTATIADGNVLTFDIDQVGSTIPGGQVTLILEGECNLEAG